MDTKHPRQYPPTRQTYVIRKFNIGLASVMFGTFLCFSNTNHVKAAETDNTLTNITGTPPAEVHKEVIQPSAATLENDKVIQHNKTTQTTEIIGQPVSQTNHTPTLNDVTPEEVASRQDVQKEENSLTSPQVNQQKTSLKNVTVPSQQNKAATETSVSASKKNQTTSQLRAANETVAIPSVNEPAPEAHATQVKVEGIEERVYQKSIPVLAGSKIARTIGMGRGNSQARESLGVILPANSTLYVRQSKATNEADLKVNLVTDDSQTNQTAVVSRDGSWTSIRTTVDSAAFMYMPRGLQSEPLIDYYIENNLFQTLPTYRKGQNQEAFETQWVDQASSFAFVDGDKHAILIPRVDRDRILAMKTNTSKFLFTSLDEFIKYYDDVISHYDQWAGLNSDPTSVNYNIGQKYFTMPDKNGIGLAYWSTDHMGMNSNSVYGFLGKGWLILHEIGHGYDGVMARDKNMNLLEVINNVYAHHYEQDIQKLGSDWLYQNHQANTQQRIHDTYLSGNTDFTFNSLGAREKLDFMTRMTRFAGMEAFAGMYQQMREQDAREGLPRDVPRWLGEYMLAENGANALAYFDLFHVPTTTQLEDRLNSYNNSYIFPLASLISDEAERQKYVERLNLKTIYELVKSSDLVDTVIQTPATITVNLNGQTLPPNSKIQLKDGTTIVAEAVVQNGRAIFDSVRAGVYKVVAPTSTTYALPEHAYLIVSESGDNTTVLNYPKPFDVQRLMTQQIVIKGLGNGVISTITYNPSTKEVLYRQNGGQPHVYFNDQPYAQVTIQTQSGEVRLDKTFIGNERQTATEQAFSMRFGDTITVMHREPQSRRQVMRPETGERLNFQDTAMQTVTYTLTDKGFIVNNETLANADARYTEAIESDIQRLITLMNTHPERDYRTQLYRIAEGLPYINTNDEARLRALLAPYLDQAQVETPKVNPIQLDQRQVYGSATPQSSIEVTLPNGEMLQTTTNVQGIWGVMIPTTSPLQVNDTISIKASMEGLQASQVVKTKVIDTIAPNTPNLYTLQAGSQLVNGSAQSNVLVKVTFADGQTAETTALTNGTWSVQTPSPLVLGDVVSVSAIDAVGNTSGTMSTQVIDTIPPTAPKVSNLEFGKNIIRGKGEHYHDVILVRFPDGQIMQTKVGRNGTWMVGVPYETQMKLKVGDVIYVFEYDQSKNRSQPAYAYVVDTKAPKAPVVHAVTEGDIVITGQSEPGSRISIVFSNGQIIEDQTTAEGVFHVHVPNTVTLLGNHSFSVTATDAYGNTSTPTVMTVQPKEEIASLEPEVAEKFPEPVIFSVREGDRTISGTSVPLSRVIIMTEDANVYGVTADDNGNYTLQLPEDVQLYESNRINVYATDTKGHDSGLIVTFVESKAKLPVVEEPIGEPEGTTNDPEVPVIETPVKEEPTEEPEETVNEPEAPAVEEPTEELEELANKPELSVIEEPKEKVSEIETPVKEEPTGEPEETVNEPEAPIEAVIPIEARLKTPNSGIDVARIQTYVPHSVESEAEIVTQVNAYCEKAFATQVKAPVDLTTQDKSYNKMRQALPETGHTSTSTKTGWLMVLLGLPFIVRIFKRQKTS